MSALRLTGRIFGILLLQLSLVPGYFIVKALTRRLPTGVVRLWMRGMCLCLGVRVNKSGSPSENGPTLFVSNHVSYIDILVLAAHCEAFFISKDDVREWPGIGKLANLRETIYINREAVREAGDLCKLLRGALLKHDLLLFPEGTTSDGLGVLDFKTSLFCMVMQGREQDIDVQPVSICYARDKTGNTLDGDRTEEYGWYGDAELAPHLLQVLKSPGVTVELKFLEPIPAGSHANRKQVAAIAHEQISQAVAQSWKTQALPER